MEMLQKKVMTVLQAVVVFFVLFMSVLPAGALENAGTGNEDQQKAQTQLQVLQALNQIAVSLTHIITYNDKVVLDQEYNTIINNLNLSNIPDEDIITLLQELMDLLTTSKINDHDRAYLAHTYEKNVQNELKKRMSTRLLDTDVLINPYSSVLQAVLNVGSFYFNYRYKLDDYKKERDEAVWKIDANTLQKLNDFYKKLLKYSWELMRKYNFPDEWRLNEKQLNDYINILKEPNIGLRYRKLARLEENFQKFPPYWYYRGQAAQEIGNKKEALYCFGQFQAIHQGILRKDPYAASTAMCKTMLILEAEETPPVDIKKDLEIILANSEDSDWGNILFAALQYARLGDSDTASKLIMRNLDNGYLTFIEDPEMIRTVGPALLLNIRPEVFTRIMDTVLKNDKIKNYDVLWLYGQLRNRDILKRIEGEFDHVLLLTENKSFLNPLNIFRADDLSLFLPTRWMADNTLITLRLKDKTGEHVIKPSDITTLPNFPDITVMTFKNVLSSKTVIKKKQSVQIAIALKHEKLAGDKTDKEAYDIEMIFKAEIMPEWQQAARIEYYAGYLLSRPKDSKFKPFTKSTVVDSVVKKDKAEPQEKDNGEPAIWFAKERLLVNGETFRWTDDGVIFE
ncbi:MAG: hypothetical protein ABWK15_05925 [Dissulfuribacterales bacterium]